MSFENNSQNKNSGKSWNGLNIHSNNGRINSERFWLQSPVSQSNERFLFFNFKFLIKFPCLQVGNVSKMSVQLRINHAGGLYDNGRSLPQFICERVLDLHHEGISQRGIAQELSTSHHFIQNVIRDCNATNTSCQPTKSHKGHSVLAQNAIECIESEKLCKPSVYCTELQNGLVLDGVVHPADLPHASTISYFLREELLMTKKKIHSVTSESKTGALEEYSSFYLDQVSDLNASSIHFFDEASVTKTTMNRCYGNATIETLAYKIQRSASNANFTINLMHSCLGVD